MSDLDPGRLLREQLDAELERRGLEPDPADVFARAARLDAGQLDALDDEHALAPFVEAYVRRIEGELDEIQPGVAPSGRRSRVGAWSVALLVAAVVLLAIGLRQWLGDPRGFIGGQRGDSTANEAQLGAVERTSSERATIPSPEPASRGRRGGSRPEPEPEVDAEPEPDPVPLEEIEPEPASSPKPSLESRLSALDAQAQAAWRTGDLRTAERRYRTIVKIGGRREVAELAYGELFSLVRQRGGDLQGLWRAYLRRFPRGRYAEDASAGLCRRAAAGERDECWARYRQRFPEGIHSP